jgi:hypothetical protein
MPTSGDGHVLRERIRRAISIRQTVKPHLIHHLTVPELSELLKSVGWASQGKKEILLARLRKFLAMTLSDHPRPKEKKTFVVEWESPISKMWEVFRSGIVSRTDAETIARRLEDFPLVAQADRPRTRVVPANSVTAFVMKESEAEDEVWDAYHEVLDSIDAPRHVFLVATERLALARRRLWAERGLREK